MKAYKGFSKDMTCRGFQYEEGKEYEEKKAKCCESGFHACEYPLDCLEYYAPNDSVYHEVELDGDIDTHNGEDSKVAATKIKIGARLTLAGMIKAAINFTMSRVKPEAKADEEHGHATAENTNGAAQATGYYGVAQATGDSGAAQASGRYGAAQASGRYGAAQASGRCGAAQVTGYQSTVVAADPESIAVAFGYKSRAKGVKGSYLVLAEWEGNDVKYWKPDAWKLKGVKTVHIDGRRYKADTFYELIGGKVTAFNG